MKESFRERVRGYLMASYPALQVVTLEYERAIPELVSVGKDAKLRAYVWNCLDGLVEQERRTKLNEETRDPLEALKFVGNPAQANIPEKSMVIFKDFHFHMQGTEVIEAIRQTTELFKSTNRFLVFLSPVQDMPLEVSKLVVLVEHELPTRQELEVTVNENLPYAKDALAKLNRADREEILDAARGLTSFEAEQAFALSWSKKKKLDKEIIHGMKKQILAKSQILEYYETDLTFEDVGGLDVLKKFLQQRKRGFSEEAAKFGLPKPKGILCAGPPGVGKSLTAKVTAKEWGVPLLRLDVGKIFAGLVGASEANMRQVIKVAEAMSPCVVWIDEFEKAFAGVASSGSTDSGVTARVVGTFLTWMQEHTEPVFVYATANDVTKLPPEMLRKGRFDEMFYVDLPNERERKSIFTIHLTRVKRDPKKFELDELVERTDQFTGAEIEQAIYSGMYTAFYRGDEVTTDHILKGILETKPIARSMSEVIAKGREWADRAVRATSSKEEDVAKTRKSM